MAVTNGASTITKSQLVTVFATPILLNSTVTLNQCDDNVDGFSAFNLNQAKQLLAANQTGYTFSFHETMEHANTNAAPISNFTQYQNQIALTDQIFVRIQTENGCFNTATLNLAILTTQIPISFSRILTVCDNVAANGNTDGISTFDFTNVKQDVLNQFPIGQRWT